ncbi:hypothetical protein [Paludisphaera sp.]|uniref:PGN_0703 family putative restriction endonuclease n=1 Tax=Paludisphaera sp. TaxID=2017432 RepID=UPI00301DF228
MTMSASRYSVARQRAWAASRGIPFNDQGRVEHLDQNLFEPLGEEAAAEFMAGDGHELHGPGGGPGHMYSLRSSSAAAVNVFHYWKRTGRISTIARACRIQSPRASSLRFEVRHPIDDILEAAGAIPPNLDVEIGYQGRGRLRATAFECKLTEPYSSGESYIKTPYLQEEMAHIWDGLPHLLELARRIRPIGGPFTYLNAAQLIKHILGLKRSYGKEGYRLVYLWNSVPGTEAVEHDAEIAGFKRYTDADDVQFSSLTYQELIARMFSENRRGNEAYVDYLAGRYL